ncbi:ATP-grasp domain-containing protein [Actinoplanes sp. NPDC049316]|uniref:ATP-grasp domain-containing protein n=1 Tax=Actinoplanes sp. NPDC049316 TaxID=3154727 RepID=UPI0034123FC0
MRHVLLINTNKETPARKLLARTDVELSVITTERFRDRYPAEMPVELVGDIENVSEVKRAALKLLAGNPFEHVVAPSEFNLQAAAFVRSYFGLPGPGYDVVNRFSNKYVMKQRLREQGILVARSARVARLRAAGQAAAELGWPIVIKPVVGGGSEDVMVVHDETELAALCAAGREEALLQFGHFLVAEEFLPIDEEFHCDGVVSAGELHLSAVARYFAPVLRSVGDVVGSYTLPEADQRTAVLRDLHARVIGALGLRDGVTHLEVFRVSDRFIVGEIAVRPGGGGIPEQLQEQYGVDIWDAFLATSLNEEFIVEKRRPDDFLAQYMLPIRNGRIARISTADDLRGIPGVVRADVRFKAGDVVSRSLNSVAMAGLVLLRAPTEASIQEAVNSVRSAFRLRVDPV